jgi:hypothetical protein
MVSDGFCDHAQILYHSIDGGPVRGGDGRALWRRVESEMELEERPRKRVWEGRLLASLRRQ